jgi:hypothetical protein
MNSSFGRGKVLGIHFRLWECKPEKHLYCGVVHIKHENEKDERFFKLEDGYVTFRSRRRKLKQVGWPQTVKTITAYEFDEALSNGKGGKLLGCKVKIHTGQRGTGIVFKMKDGRVAVKTIYYCRCKKHRQTVYLTSAWSLGDLVHIHNYYGEHLGNIRDNVATCPNCRQIPGKII